MKHPSGQEGSANNDATWVPGYLGTWALGNGTVEWLA